jgi:alkanesulfonate monooxygenase SsuD/methylene tetrahydromethanopterin reductase-like flavin-dependent oxidoreductase (luciferase family)
MKIGLQIPNFTFPSGPESLRSALAKIAQTANEVGFYSLWVMDHFFQIGGGDRSGLLSPAENECWRATARLPSWLALRNK